MDDDAIMGFGKCRTVMNNLWRIPGNINQLIVFRLQRTDIKEPVFRKLVKRDKPFAIRILGLTHGSVVMPRLIMDIDLGKDRIDLFTVELANRGINVPFAHLTIKEQGGIGIPLTIKRGM